MYNVIVENWQCPRCQFQYCPVCDSVVRSARLMVAMGDVPVPGIYPCDHHWHDDRPMTVPHEIPRDLLPDWDVDPAMGLSDFEVWVLGIGLFALLLGGAVAAAFALINPMWL